MLHQWPFTSLFYIRGFVETYFLCWNFDVKSWGRRKNTIWQICELFFVCWFSILISLRGGFYEKIIRDSHGIFKQFGTAFFFASDLQLEMQKFRIVPWEIKYYKLCYLDIEMIKEEIKIIFLNLIYPSLNWAQTYSCNETSKLIFHKFRYLPRLVCQCLLNWNTLNSFQDFGFKRFPKIRSEYTSPSYPMDQLIIVAKSARYLEN